MPRKEKTLILTGKEKIGGPSLIIDQWKADEKRKKPYRREAATNPPDGRNNLLTFDTGAK